MPSGLMADSIARRCASSASNFLNVPFMIVFDDEVNGCLTQRSTGEVR